MAHLFVFQKAGNSFSQQQEKQEFKSVQPESVSAAAVQKPRR